MLFNHLIWSYLYKNVFVNINFIKLFATFSGIKFIYIYIMQILLNLLKTSRIAIKLNNCCMLKCIYIFHANQKQASAYLYFPHIWPICYSPVALFIIHCRKWREIILHIKIFDWETVCKTIINKISLLSCQRHSGLLLFFLIWFWIFIYHI